jgi:ceramide synthetase
MSFVRTLLDKFWNPEVWLPPNVTWADLEPNDKVAYADHSHLIIPLPLAFVLLALRIVLERLVEMFWSCRFCYVVIQYLDFHVTAFLLCRYWFTPVGISLGIKNTKPKKAPPNAILERAYLLKRKIKHKQVSTSVHIHSYFRSLTFGW